MYNVIYSDVDFTNNNDLTFSKMQVRRWIKNQCSNSGFTQRRNPGKTKNLVWCDAEQKDFVLLCRKPMNLLRQTPLLGHFQKRSYPRSPCLPAESTIPSLRRPTKMTENSKTIGMPVECFHPILNAFHPCRLCRTPIRTLINTN